MSDPVRLLYVQPRRRRSARALKRAAAIAGALALLLAAAALREHLYGNRPAPTPYGDASSPAHPAGCLPRPCQGATRDRADPPGKTGPYSRTAHVLP